MGEQHQHSWFRQTCLGHECLTSCLDYCNALCTLEGLLKASQYKRLLTGTSGTRYHNHVMPLLFQFVCLFDCKFPEVRVEVSELPLPPSISIYLHSERLLAGLVHPTGPQGPSEGMFSVTYFYGILFLGNSVCSFFSLFHSSLKMIQLPAFVLFLALGLVYGLDAMLYLYCSLKFVGVKFFWIERG